MKKVLLIASALLLLASCNRFGTRTYQDDLVMPLAEASADSLFFSISLEYATGGMLIPAMDRMNSAIIGHAFDVEDASATLEETAVRYRENLIDEYLTENGDQEEPHGVLTWEDQITGSFTGDYKKWKNYSLTYYSFRGGAHGIQTLSQLVFDKKTGELIPEASLFVPDYQEPLAELLKEAIRQSMEKEYPELLSLVEMQEVQPNGNFSLGPNGIQWVFQPYEVAPYALETVMATLSWEQLKPYLL